MTLYYIFIFKNTVLLIHSEDTKRIFLEMSVSFENISSSVYPVPFAEHKPDLDSRIQLLEVALRWILLHWSSESSWIPKSDWFNQNQLFIFILLVKILLPMRKNLKMASFYTNNAKKIFKFFWRLIYIWVKYWRFDN